MSTIQGYDLERAYAYQRRHCPNQRMQNRAALQHYRFTPIPKATAVPCGTYAKIKIATYGTVTEETIRAITTPVDGLVIHHGLIYDDKDRPYYAPWWVISHVPTGRNIGHHFPNALHAMRYVRAIAPYGDWYKHNPRGPGWSPERFKMLASQYKGKL